MTSLPAVTFRSPPIRWSTRFKSVAISPFGRDSAPRPGPPLKWWSSFEICRNTQLKVAWLRSVISFSRPPRIQRRHTSSWTHSSASPPCCSLVLRSCDLLSRAKSPCGQLHSPPCSMWTRFLTFRASRWTSATTSRGVTGIFERGVFSQGSISRSMGMSSPMSSSTPCSLRISMS